MNIIIKIEKIQELIKYHKISVNTRKFLEWCAIKFNIEEILKDCSKKRYTSLESFFDDIGLKMSTNIKTRKKDLELIDKYFCKVDRITTRTIEISELKSLELSEFPNMRNVYCEIFSLLFNNWLHIERQEQITILTTEDIAIEMGVLKSYYQLFKGTHQEYAEWIKTIDKKKRLDDLIDKQLTYMQVNSHKLGHFYKVERPIVEYRKEYIPVPQIGETLVRQHFKSYVTDTRLLKMYEEACKLQKFPPECQNMMPMWKIIAPKDSNFISLDEDIKHLITRILIINKRDKVYRAIILAKGNELVDVEDFDDDTAWEIRNEHRNSEIFLDQETGYYDVNVGFIPMFGDKKPIRKIYGEKINKAREEIKLKLNRKSKDFLNFQQIAEQQKLNDSMS